MWICGACPFVTHIHNVYAQSPVHLVHSKLSWVRKISTAQQPTASKTAMKLIIKVGFVAGLISTPTARFLPISHPYLLDTIIFFVHVITETRHFNAHDSTALIIVAVFESIAPRLLKYSSCTVTPITSCAHSRGDLASCYGPQL